MTSITLHHINAPREAESVTAALHELAVATRHLMAALWASLIQRNTPTELTAHDEANNLRAMADRVAMNDPHFAQDLYAAADRHEWGANAG
jgi:hypothetical protein